LNIKRQSYGTEEIPFSPFSESDSHLFVSGQGGNDPLTGEIKIGDLESQTINTVKNIEIILGQRGLTLKDVVKVNIFLTNRQHYEQFNQIYSLLFSRPYPARTLVYCDLNFDLLVEIDVIAKLKPYEKM
jgi:2-iminobutanoate/2-iminopropanoate deaminase